MASSLVVGTDTYISVADATTYIAANYTTTETEYTTWAALSETNKDVYMKRACRKIERQKYQGIKAVYTQTLEFPRALRTDYRREEYPALNILLNNDWVIQSAVPNNVKYAQIEEAIAMAQGTPDRVKIQREGVKSFRLGNLSESYSGSSEKYSLISDEAKNLLSDYLIGSIAIT